MMGRSGFDVWYQGKALWVRVSRRVLVVFSLALILILALGLCGIAAGLYAYFGSGKAVTAQGPRIELAELASCATAVIDLDRIEVVLPDQFALLPGPQQELRISTQPQVTVSAVVLPREGVDAALLGFDSCLITLDSQTWSINRSAVGQPWLQVDKEAGFSDAISGESVAFDVGTVSNSTLIIGFGDPNPSIKKLLLDAEVSYPDADGWALGCAIAAGVLLALFVMFTVIVIVKGTHRPRSSESHS
jgi:hypothetical protein